MNLTLRMQFRAKALLCAITCLAAVLTAATLAQAVDQTPKNGCTSPQAYEGSITSPPFVPLAERREHAQHRVPGLVRDRERRTRRLRHDDGGVQPRCLRSGGAREWIQFGELTDPAQVQPNSGGAPDKPYSNNGTGVTPGFQPFNFPIPVEAHNQPNVQVRIRFATGDQTYQGFRGLGCGHRSTSPRPEPGISTGLREWRRRAWSARHRPTARAHRSGRCSATRRP